MLPFPYLRYWLYFVCESFMLRRFYYHPERRLMVPTSIAIWGKNKIVVALAVSLWGTNVLCLLQGRSSPNL